LTCSLQRIAAFVPLQHITMATSLHPNLTVMKSRAFDTLFTKIRDVETNSGDFVHYSKRAMRLLAEEVREK